MHDLLENFGVNWKLLTAQVVNFAILFYILKRFAYGPIVAMLKERQDRITKGLQEASLAEIKLRESEEKKKEVIDAANKKGLEIVDDAEEKALLKQAEIIETGHKKADSVFAAAERAIGEERLKMQDEIHADASELVQSAVVRVLGKMKPEERDKMLIEDALKELKMVGKKS